MASSSAFAQQAGTASRDLAREWRSCCLRAGGWDEAVLDAPTEDRDCGGDSSSLPHIKLINLAGPSPHDTNMQRDRVKNSEESNGWLDALREIENNLHLMIVWLHEKRWSYVSVETPEDEASLIQSTIASYTASTANELEELRSVLIAKQRQEYADRPQAFEHHSAVVQALIQKLKEEIAEPFGKLQKQRHRLAVKIWQNPLSVEIFIPPARNVDEMDAVLGIADEHPFTDYQFRPTLPRLPLQQNFMQSYEDFPDDMPLERPESVFTKRPKRAPASPIAESPVTTSTHAEKRTKPNQHKPFLGLPRTTAAATSPLDSDSNAMYASPEPQELQQEAVLLKASLENDLDQVQKMETTMVNITQLLSQFADLVASQQEDIVQIHDAAEVTKENMEKGQEKLLDAAEQSRHSNHYMATAITMMGVLLLFVHFIRP